MSALEDPHFGFLYVLVFVLFVAKWVGLPVVIEDFITDQHVAEPVLLPQIQSG